MKSLLQYTLAVALALAAAAPAAAQQPGAAPGREQAPPALREQAERRAFEALLRHRAELELSEQQVRQIEAIGRRLQEQNAPLRQRLVEEARRWREERRAQLERLTPEQRREELRRMRGRRGQAPVPEAMQPLVRQMRLNINEAMHQARGVLTAEQRLRAEQVLRRQLRDSRRPGMRGPGMRRPGMRPMRGRRPPRDTTP